MVSVILKCSIYLLTSLLDVCELVVNCMVFDCKIRLNTSGTYRNGCLHQLYSCRKKYKISNYKIKHYTLCLPSLVFPRSKVGLPSENRKSPRSSRCLLTSDGGTGEEDFCLTQTKSWPPTAMPTIMCVPYEWMNLHYKAYQLNWW